MGKNKRLKEIVDLLFWGYILISVVIQIVTGIKQGSINLGDITIAEMTTPILINLCGMFLFLFVFNLIIVLLKNLIIVCIYFGIKFALKKYAKDKLTDDDFNKDKMYYREIIKEYSPAVLSYIDDFNITEDDMIATLMSLEIKKKIKIGEEIIVLDRDENGLDENEKYIFNHISNSTLSDANLYEFKAAVLEDCKSAKLVEENKDIKKKVIKKIIVNILIFALIIFTFNVGPDLINAIVNKLPYMMLVLFGALIILFFVMIAYPITTMIYIKVYYMASKINSFVRNKKGAELNLKLEGLKKYLKEYTLINERKKEELILWEDYLIYSVIFNQNQRIVKEYNEKLVSKK